MKDKKTQQEKDDDDFVDYWIGQQPILTEREQEKELTQMLKCADFIRKHKIEPNLDSIY